MLEKPIAIESRHQHRGRVIDVWSERLRFPSGREHELDLVRHPGAAAVVALDHDSRVCLVRQYRHAIGEFLWEIPAGKLDQGEAPEACAVRELAEETGVVARRWDALGRYFPAPALYTEVIHLYFARELEIGAPAPDVDEELEIAWVPLEEAVGRVLQGEINDGKTALALLRARHELQL